MEEDGNHIPDSDVLAVMMEDQQKIGRLDTVSTNFSDKPASKKNQTVYYSLYQSNFFLQ